LRNSGEDSGGLIVTLSIVGGIGLFAYIILSARLGIPFAIPVGIVGAIATAVALHGPVGKAIGRRLEGGSPPGADETTGALLGEMDELRQRVAELEERADFSERLLAQQSERSRLAGGSET
jgi:hypothetical protein